MQGNVVDNRYDVVRPLGSGGMGEVYLARDRVLGRDVALKILRSQYAGDKDSADRFKREARSAASLSHPNIVQVYDRGDTADGSSYIAMEYVPGGTLKDRIRREGSLRPELAASFGYQVAEALGAAHAKGIVHRDIKPQNVLITDGGDAKVTDFGIARAASAASAAATQTGTILGTAGYMSPEQALGEPATPKSDLYSLGVVLYEALTGELPFTADNPVAVTAKHVNEAPRPPNAVDPNVPENMNAVVMRLLAKNPEDRYPGADALAEALWRARRGGPSEATTVPEATAPGATARTPRVAPAARRAGGRGAPRRKKRGFPLIPLALLLLLVGVAGLAWALVPLGGQAGRAVEVPPVEGLSRDRAVADLREAGLSPEVQTEESSTSEAGRVISQSPPGGADVPQGETVSLTVGAGSANVTVPDVGGLGVTEAEAELESAGLTLGSTYDVPSNVAAGVVLEQGVGAGAEVPENTPVDLGLSTGPAAPTTPSASASANQEEPTTETSVAPDSSTSAGADRGGPSPGGAGDGAGAGSAPAREQAPSSASATGEEGESEED